MKVVFRWMILAALVTLMLTNACARSVTQTVFGADGKPAPNAEVSASFIRGNTISSRMPLLMRRAL